MKIPVLRLVSCFALIVALAAPARAGVLLTIDWSNLSAVKVTATGNAPAFSYGDSLDLPAWPGGASSFKGEDGITFVNFLTSASAMTGNVGPGANPSTLSDYSGNSIFDQFYVLSGGQGGSLKDLNLFANNTTSDIRLANGQASFTGEAVFNLSGGDWADLVSLLPGVGASGNLVLWNTFDYPIGTWSVTGAATAVPEPSTYALLAGLGALGLAAWRRRSVRAQN